MTDTLPRVSRSVSGYYWAFTEADQRDVDAHWNPDFFRHTVINTQMYFASLPGAGVPGWDPFLSVDRRALGEVEYWRLAANSFADQVREYRVQPTGLEDDPRLPAREGGGDILGLLRDAAARYPVEVAAEHAAMLAEHTALSASWAGRLRAGPTPTLEDARRRRAERLSPPRSDWAVTVSGTWRPWEIEEILKEQARADGIERAWMRAEDAYKAINPSWGGGT